MFWGILHRTIFMELLRVFLLALVALTGILLMGGIFAEATQRGLSPGQILGVIPLLIPNTLPYTLPTTTLFATCVVFGRLAHDNEILAIKAAGINLLHVTWPAVLLGLLASATTFGLYLHTIPATHFMLRNRIADDVEEVLYTMLKRDGFIRHSKVGYDIFVKRVDGKKLIEALFMRRDPKTRLFDVIAWAREAELRVDLPHRQIIVSMHHCHISSNNCRDEGFVLDKDWPVDLPVNPDPVKARGSQFDWYELLEKIEELKEKIRVIQDEIDLHQATVNQGVAPANFPEHIQQLTHQRDQARRQLAEMMAEVNLRPALALGCLCFVLVGCPVGIWFSKSDYLSAFVTCFLPIVVLYYPLLLCGINFAKSGKFHPAAALWMANSVLAIIALALFRRLLKN